MIDAFKFYFDDKITAAKIKLDPFAWSRDYEPNSKIDIDGYIVESSNLYIDSRSESEYLKFSKYFTKREESEL